MYDLRYVDVINPIYLTKEFLEPYAAKEPPFANAVALITAMRTYLRFVDEFGRREKWWEMCLRVTEYSLSLYRGPASFEELKKEAEEFFDHIFNLKIFPAGRTMWIGGTKVTDTDGTSNMNCSFRVIDSLDAYSEMLYLSLCGSGTGFSVERRYVDKLPKLIVPEVIHQPYNPKPKDKRYENTIVKVGTKEFSLRTPYLINKFDSCLERHADSVSAFEASITVGDSKVGWAVAVKALLRLLTCYSIKQIIINYDSIRRAGERLMTFGGRASGPDPLRWSIGRVMEIIKACDGRLSSRDAMDISNILGFAVVSGGVRRTAQITLGDIDDVDFITAKYGLWDEKNHPELKIFQETRSLSNNSVHVWKKPPLKQLKDILARARYNGEPGFYIAENALKRHPRYKGTNPCGEILLDSSQTCNLCEVVVSAFVKNGRFQYKEFEYALRLATRHGSRITNIQMWHPDWDVIQKRDRLLGVSLTGQVDAWQMLGWAYQINESGSYTHGTDERVQDVLHLAKQAVRTEADSYHAEMGIPQSLLTTCVKPSGCRPWNALTTTDQGVLTLEELLEKHPDDKVWGDMEGYRAVNEGVLSKITKSYNNGVETVHDIQLSLGFRLQSTGNHRWFVKERVVRSANSKRRLVRLVDVHQWVETKDLQPGDVIEVRPNTYNKVEEAPLQRVNKLAFSMRNDATPILQPDRMNPELGWLLGYLWGNGAMSQGGYRIRFVDELQTKLEKVEQILRSQFGIDSSVRKLNDRKAFSLEVGSKHLWHWLIKNEVWKYYADGLDIIPKIVRSSSRETIIAFIAGLVDSDGWVGYSRKEQQVKTVVLSSAYDLFAEHLQHVALSVGLCIGRSLNSKGDNLQEQKHIWLMGFNQYSDSESFEILSKHSLKIQSIYHLPGRWVHENPARNTKPLGEVISIQESGEMPTFDIEVENTHWYYAGAFKSHNTVSLVAGCSSGAHMGYAPYYIRRMQIDRHDPLAHALLSKGLNPRPKNNQGDDLYGEGVTTWVFDFPMTSNTPIRAIDEPAVSQLERYKELMRLYVEHNVSFTCSVDDHEWDTVAEWVYKNWDDIVGIAFFPKFDPTIGTPNPDLAYIPCSKEAYQELAATMPQFTESELNDLVAQFETEYEEYSLDSECSTGACPVR
jgi:adenosylcobalamin-dependent ribonucleoside-triphosphate reductase